MRYVGLFAFYTFVTGCAVAPESAPPQADEAGDEQEALSLGQSAGFYVALGRCDVTGTKARLVNKNDGDACLGPLAAATGADAATKTALSTVGSTSGDSLFKSQWSWGTTTPVTSVFKPATSLYRPLADSVSGQLFFQVTASSCKTGATFTAAQLNGTLFTNKYGYGTSDVRVTYARPLPSGWTETRVRNEVLYEQAAFRGTVERPTFDILHPTAERPLLITVFDLLPALRTTARCP